MYLLSLICIQEKTGMKQNKTEPAMTVIGITGGVGSGKSRVLEELCSSFGAVVCQADEVAKELQKKGGRCYDEMIHLFGTGILGKNEEMDRKKLAEIVFSDPEKLRQLNAIVHPEVKQAVITKIRQEKERGSRLFVIEAALLLEDHYDEICDELWYIYTKESVRRARLKESRDYSDEKIDAIMKNQMNEEVFFKRCRRVIDNSGSFEDTKKQLAEILQDFGNTGKLSSVYEESQEK